MFGKLLKNEFISTGRIMGILYAVVLVIMGYLLGSYYIGRNAAEADPSNGQLVGVFLLMMISFCSFILTTVVMITNFQKTLYGKRERKITLIAVKCLLEVCDHHNCCKYKAAERNHHKKENSDKLSV